MEPWPGPRHEVSHALRKFARKSMERWHFVLWPEDDNAKQLGGETTRVNGYRNRSKFDPEPKPRTYDEKGSNLRTETQAPIGMDHPSQKLTGWFCGANDPSSRVGRVTPVQSSSPMRATQFKDACVDGAKMVPATPHNTTAHGQPTAQKHTCGLTSSCRRQHPPPCARKR